MYNIYIIHIKYIYNIYIYLYNIPSCYYRNAFMTLWSLVHLATTLHGYMLLAFKKPKNAQVTTTKLIRKKQSRLKRISISTCYDRWRNLIIDLILWVYKLMIYLYLAFLFATLRTNSDSSVH